MRISTKGRYALTLMLELARYQGDGFLTLKDVSERQRISVKYLEMIVSNLKKANFVVGQRGKTGGYRLARKPSEYSVGSILKLCEGSLAPVKCLEEGQLPCEKAQSCLTLPLWTRLDQLIDEYLESVTLQDLLEGKV